MLFLDCMYVVYINAQVFLCLLLNNPSCKEYNVKSMEIEK